MPFGLFVDIILCILTYSILMTIIFWQSDKRRTGSDNGDDDGGIPVWTEPELDLPPGVSLPTDGPSYKKEVLEEQLA